MNAELICVGTELLLGQIVNTNAAFISKRLAEIGINVYYHVTVGDNRERLKSAFLQAWKRSDIVVTTGGLGPTMDDLTKQTISEALGIKLIINEQVKASIEEFLSRYGAKVPASVMTQALVPEGSRVFINKVGTAPGILVEKDGKFVVMLPGPPFEVESICQELVPELAKLAGQECVILSRVIKVCGIPEASVEERIKDLLETQSNPTIAPLVYGPEVHLRVTAKASNQNEAKQLIAGTESQIRDRLGDLVFGVDEETLECSVLELLRELNLSISVAESCTGGLLSARLTSVPGSSKHFLLGLCTYSEESKQDVISVPRAVIEKFGVVSGEVALAMAAGVSELARSDMGIGITGVAGPDPGPRGEEVGTVYIGMSSPWVKKSWLRRYDGSREQIRNRIVSNVLIILRRQLLEFKRSFHALSQV